MTRILTRLASTTLAIAAGCGLALGALPSVAQAQTLGAGGQLAAEETIVEGAGIKAGEGVLVHPSVGMETGFLSNVFFTESNEEASGILRLIAELHVASLNAQRLQDGTEDESEPDGGEFQFRGGFRLAYEEYLSSNDAVQAQRDLGIHADIRGVVFPKGTWLFAFSDQFSRITRPTNFESSGNIQRDVNHLALFLRFQPGGRALQATARYENVIDFFERDSHRFANRIQHTLGLRTSWQWLPVTQFYADASIGIYDGLGADSQKVSSFPLRVVAGTRTALTVNTTLSAEVGYGKGFYSTGADYSTVVAGAEFGWRFSPLGRLLLLYRHELQDSINANYFRDHQAKISLEQQVDRFTLDASFDARFRRYEGILLDSSIMPSSETRDDVILSAELGARYHFREWLAATFDYRFVSDETDFRYTTDGVVDDPSYVRHEVYVGAMAAF
jgi:hypothetical protein